MWYPPLMIGIFFAPESPWWLIRKGKIAEARRSLLRLTSAKANPDYNPDETIDMIRYTTELEQDITAGASYLDCFRGEFYFKLQEWREVLTYREQPP
jgi:SP family general alpha glucoside:H+ symporter-like MFS transporter